MVFILLSLTALHAERLLSEKQVFNITLLCFHLFPYLFSGNDGSIFLMISEKQIHNIVIFKCLNQSILYCLYLYYLIFDGHVSYRSVKYCNYSLI